MRHHLPHIAFVLPALTAYAAFALFPLVLNVWYSLTNWSALSIDTEFVGLENYSRLFSDPAFFRSLRVTMLFVVLVVPVQLILSVLTASCISGASWFSGLTRFAILVPLAMSPIAAGLLFNLLASPSVGLLPRLFGDGATLSNPAVAVGLVAAAQVWSFLGITTFIFLSAMIQIPTDYYEAAALDGAGPAARFFRITLPLLRPALVIAAVYAVAMAFRSFGLILALTNGGPLGVTRVISMLMYRESFNAFRLGYGSAIATVLVILIAVTSTLPLLINAIRTQWGRRADA